MKKGILVLIFFLFIFKFYYDYNKEKEIEEKVSYLSSEIININDDVEEIVNKNIVYNDVNNKIEQVFSTLNRDQYNLVVEEINNVQYIDVKEKLLAKSVELEKEITALEERLYSPKETLRGSISAFTAYCSDGCHGYTASGRYVGGGNIYYNDKDYGTVMIVAGDKSYPFGTIVRFNNLKYFNRDIYAIVLDRGGAVGKNRKVLFDLLMTNDNVANTFGIARGVQCDILRIGY